MGAGHNVISCMFMGGMGANLWMMGSIIIPENQACICVLIVVAVTEPQGFFSDKDDSFANF